MNLKGLLLSCDIDYIIPYILRIDPNSIGSETAFKEAYDILCHTEEKETKGTIRIIYQECLLSQECKITAFDCEGELWENCLGNGDR